MNIGVIFGSQSTEHEVSVASAFGIMQGLKKNTDHTIFPIYITPKGKWVYEPGFLDKDQLKELVKRDFLDTELSINFSKTEKLYITQKKKGILTKKEQLEVDMVFCLLHGKNGEDGSIQGIFQLLQVPFVSPGVLWSAMGMNKIAMKDICKASNIPTVKSIAVYEMPSDISTIESLWFPMFVKPANLWSSIGITKVNSKAELSQALEVAFHYDTQVICEKAVENVVELNCSILVNKGKVEHSLIEKISTQANFLSFEEKYINNGGTMQWIEEKVQIPAKIPQQLEDQIFSLCQQVANVLHIDGGAPRIDFLRDEKNDELYVNEINTIPGALQLHLWEASGISMKNFFEILIESAIYRRNEEQTTSTLFSSGIVDLTVSFKK